jgi:8-oxo-dGTP pyrophosphatase MutT (NUDIX family)
LAATTANDPEFKRRKVITPTVALLHGLFTIARHAGRETDDMTPNPYMPSTTSEVVAAGLILRRDFPKGFRWLLLRATKHGEWGFPKGHQDAGESAVQTALRECAEECGIALLAIEGKPLEATYRLPNGRSKSVIYYPAVTEQTTVELSSEHSECAWLNAQEVIDCLPHANLVLLFRAYLHALGKG